MFIRRKALPPSPRVGGEEIKWGKLGTFRVKGLGLAQPPHLKRGDSCERRRTGVRAQLGKDLVRSGRLGALQKTC